MRTTLVTRKKSVIMALAIAAIITTSVLAFTLPNQLFSQTGGHGGWLVGHSGLLGQVNQRLTDSVTQANVKVLGQEITQGIRTQVGNAWVIKGPGHPGLGYQWDPGHLGYVCLSCFGH